MNTFIMESSVVRPATNPYGRLDRNSVVGYEGEHNSRSLVVETTDDLSAYASVSLIIDDLDCGAMTKTTSGSKTVLSLTLTSAMIGASGRKLCQLLMVDSNNTVIAKSSQFVILIKRSNDIERSVEDGVSFIIISEAVTEMAQEAASAAAEEAAADVVAECQTIANAAAGSASAAAQSAAAAQAAAKSIVVDSTLDTASTNAIQNKAVAGAISELRADLDNLDTGITPAQQGLLISILRKAVYDGNQQELIDALEDSFGGIVHVTDIAFAQASISINDVEAVTASYTITPANGTDPILWESSNQNIVTVSNGVITPVGNGSATITAYTPRGISATLSVTVALPATYSVTNNLTHATNSNSSALIVEGNSYTGVITADEGYVVTSVAVTMGGTDVTSTVYANGTISIASVTGDIVITVGTAIAPPTPVYKGENLVFDGTANTVIDTGIKLCDTDKDFTIVLKVDTPTGSAVTGGSQLICCSAGSNGYDGYHIARASSTNLAPRAYVNSGKIDFSDAYNALDDRTQVIIMRHESGSGKIIASAYVYKNSAVSVGTLTQNFTFSAHDNTTIIGARRWNGINGHITGTLKLVEIYNRYLTDEQIAGYYE